MLPNRLISTLAAAALLAGCGGGGGPSSSLPNHAAAAGTPLATGIAALTLTLPNAPSATGAALARTASQSRLPKFISGGINGIFAAAGDSATYPTGANTATFDVSLATGTGSGKTCTDNGDGSRTCTLFIPAPAGASETIFIATYNSINTSPLQIPATATPLSTGSATVGIAAAATNTVTLTLAAIFGQVIPAPGFVTGLGLPQRSATFSTALTDGAGYPVSGAFSVAPTLGPNGPMTEIFQTDSLKFSVSENNGTGHMTLTTANGTCPGSATILQSTAPLADLKVCYDGSGGQGYNSIVTLTDAANFSVFGRVYISPLIVTSSKTGLSGVGDSATIRLDEFGEDQAGSRFFASTEAGCTGVSLNQSSTTTNSTVSYGLLSASTDGYGTFTVTQTAASGACTIDFSDDGGAVEKVAFAGGSTTFTITITP